MQVIVLALSSRIPWSIFWAAAREGQYESELLGHIVSVYSLIIILRFIMGRVLREFDDLARQKIKSVYDFGEHLKVESKLYNQIKAIY